MADCQQNLIIRRSLVEDGVPASSLRIEETLQDQYGGYLVDHIAPISRASGGIEMAVRLGAGELFVP
jgi:hypothetical protein